MKKSTIMPTKLLDMVQLIDENELPGEMGTAFASFMLNPTVTWAKFILTDDRKNANNQRIPKEEFANLMKSGIHMPVKMAIGEISRGHTDSRPLGVITHLKETPMPDGSSAIIALAALWGEERPADVGFIKDRFGNGQPVNVSWEILYSESSFNNDTNSMDLTDTVLRAATIVGEPAYEGRTQFLSVAAKKWSKAYIESLPNDAFLYVNREGERYLPIKDLDGKVDRTKLNDAMESLGQLGLPGDVMKQKKAVLTQLISRFEAGASLEEVTEEFAALIPKAEEVNKMNLEELQAAFDAKVAELETANASLTAKDTLLAEKDTEIASLTEKITTIETELTPLKELKASIEAKAENEAKLEEVKKKFVEAEIEKTDEYFTTNSEKLLAMDEGQLSFMLQELKAFASEKPALSTSSVGTKIPPLNGEDTSELSISDMAEYLRTRGKK